MVTRTCGRCSALRRAAVGSDVIKWRSPTVLAPDVAEKQSTTIMVIRTDRITLHRMRRGEIDAPPSIA